MGREPPARALPAGTPLDSAAQFLANAGVDFTVDTAAGGQTIVGMARDVDADLFVSESVQIRLSFDAAGRLTARRTASVLTGP